MITCACDAFAVLPWLDLFSLPKMKERLLPKLELLFASRAEAVPDPLPRNDDCARVISPLQIHPAKGKVLRLCCSLSKGKGKDCPHALHIFHAIMTRASRTLFSRSATGSQEQL